MEKRILDNFKASDVYFFTGYWFTVLITMCSDLYQSSPFSGAAIYESPDGAGRKWGRLII